MLQKWKDGDLKYMWQLNFAHNDLRTALENGKDDIEFIDADDSRLFEVKNKKKILETLFHIQTKKLTLLL